MAELISGVDFKKEAFLFLALIFSTLFYFLPLNAWLCGFAWRRSAVLLKWNFLGSLITWVFYRIFRPVVEEYGHTGVLITALVFLNALLFYSLVRFLNVHEKSLNEERIWGWILFSPVLMIAVVISTPLFGALITAMLF